MNTASTFLRLSHTSIGNTGWQSWKRCFAVATLAAVMTSAVGCGGGAGDGADTNRPKTSPVTGVITHKNAPLADAKVTFVSVSSEGTGAVAVTNEKGEFSLMTFEPNDGAVPGAYKVTVTKTEAVKGELTENSDAPVAEAPKSLLPEKYAVPRTSGLDAEVKDGQTNNFTFNLE